LASGLWAEIRRLFDVLRRAWRERGYRAFLFTGVIAIVIVVAWAVDHTSARTAVAWCCGERVGEPLRTGLLRLPGSMVVPSPMLPVWGSLAQVILAFGLSEAAVGRSRTAGVAVVANLAATLAGRVFVWLGVGHFGGLPASWLHAIDTGPSAATVGLAAYLAIALRCPLLGGVLVSGIAGEVLLKTDLAGREHAVALLVGLAFGAGHLWTLRRSADRATAEQAESNGAERVGAALVAIACAAPGDSAGRRSVAPPSLDSTSGSALAKSKETRWPPDEFSS
jgi:hypothetical protein